MAASASSKEIIQKMYVAYYGRPADPAGQEYWGSVLDEAIQTGGGIESIIDAFGNSQEYLDGIGSGTTTSQVTALYQQMFGRSPEQAGLDYWVDQIDNQGVTLGYVALKIADGASGDDDLTLRNKITAGQYYTDQIVQTGASYTSAELSDAKNLIAAVTKDAQTVTDAYTATDQLMDKQGGGEVIFTLTSADAYAAPENISEPLIEINGSLQVTTGADFF